MGLGFAILNEVLNFALGLDFHLYRFVFNFIIFGGIMSWLLVSINKSQLRMNGITKLTDENTGLKYQKKIISDLSQKELLNAIKEKEYFSGANIKINGNNVIIYLKKGHVSWGELITINSKEVEAGKNEFLIISKPRFLFTLLDGGANYTNVRKIVDLLG